MNHFTDLSPYAQQGSDIFHVPDVFTNTFTVQSQSTHGAELTTGSPTSVDVTLTVNTHKYVATLLGYLLQQQIASTYNLGEIYARKVGGTLLEDFEDALFALWSGLTTNSVGDTATVLTDSEIRRSVEKLATADFPLDECAWFFHPYTYWVQILAVQRYYDASQWGAAANQNVLEQGTFGGRGNINQGYVGSLYGIRAYTSSRVVSGLQTHRNLLAHKTAFGFAHQTPGGNRVRFQAENWLANLGILSVWDTIYGVVEMRDAAAVVVNANNVFIGS